MRMRKWAIGCVAAAVFAAIGVSAEDRPIRVACIGDSITHAASTGERGKTDYPAQMQGMLGAGFEVKNFGVSGATMLKKSELPYWSRQEYADAKAFAPDIVAIKLGTNDYKPQHWNKDAYAADYRAMIDELQALPSHPRIILVRPVPAFSEAFKIRNSVIIGDIIPIVDKISVERSLPEADAYNRLLSRGAEFPDGIHPNEAGCKELAATVAEQVRALAASVAR